MHVWKNGSNPESYQKGTIRIQISKLVDISISASPPPPTPNTPPPPPTSHPPVFQIRKYSYFTAPLSAF